MSKSLLITGGASSGKSRWAATYFAACDYVLYLKSGESMDHDTLARIEYSNNQHGVEWDIVVSDETSPADKVGDHKFVIFDSLSSYSGLVINEMCPDPAKLDEEMKKAIEKRIIDDITALREKVEENDGSMIIITIETGFSDPSDKSFRRDILGRINQRIANSSEEVYFSASGIQFKIK